MRLKPLTLERGEWTADMGPELHEAQNKLASAIAAGQVHAWGRRQAHELTEKIPNDPFRIRNLRIVVGPYGEMTTLPPFQRYIGPRWHSIEFEADEIKQAFPVPPPVSARDWMLKEAQQTRAKRYLLVQECMKATNCTKRQAEAAYKSLPDELKWKRGRPRRDIG
jgi:hypothetical protein